jgi:hypothetical protein
LDKAKLLLAAIAGAAKTMDTTANFCQSDVFSPLACLSIVAEHALASLPVVDAAEVSRWSHI